MSESRPARLAVLAVEDDPVLARFLVDALVGCGHEVHLAPNGTRAHELARARRFDLLLVDLQLPDTDGASLLMALRSDPDVMSRNAPAIAMSGELPSDRRNELVAIGFREAWQKPVPIETLEALTMSQIGAERMAHSPPMPSHAMDLDDDAALARLGSASTMKALRGLLASELPRQWRAICVALDSGDAAAAASVTHRARAGCTLCGANAAAAALAAIDACLQNGHDATSARAHADSVIMRTLASLVS